jgi:uncharacterized protein (TIGR00251 family)
MTTCAARLTSRQPAGMSRVVSDLPVRERDGEVWFSVRVQPRASRDAIAGVIEGALRVSLTAPPVEGEANAALIAFVAKTLGVAKRDVRIAQGTTGRNKVLAVRGVDAGVVRALGKGQ